jgi:hypothetical protein
MSHLYSPVDSAKQAVPFILASRPCLPNTRQPVSEKRVSDPSSSSPRGTSYPIPTFFDYRAKAKDFEAL